ncbi:hypothetical protein ACFFK0_13070 [Paenibacillus chartarius]|uniref:Uncharacterized protein n=1 Tax=Paenibacillus chartarius TaxID=747481 RepID=A0ABV6DL44_9BACL
MSIIFFPRYEDDRPKIISDLESDLRPAVQKFIYSVCTEQGAVVEDIQFKSNYIEGNVWEADLYHSNLTVHGLIVGKEVLIGGSCDIKSELVLDRSLKEFVPYTRVPDKSQRLIPSYWEIMGLYILKLAAYVVLVMLVLWLWRNIDIDGTK